MNILRLSGCVVIFQRITERWLGITGESHFKSNRNFFEPIGNIFRPSKRTNFQLTSGCTPKKKFGKGPLFLHIVQIGITTQLVCGRHQTYPSIVSDLLERSIGSVYTNPSPPSPHQSFLRPRASDPSILLANAQEAQKLNAKFTSMTTDTACKTGDMACIAGAFSQCVNGKFLGTPYTEADTIARITQAGASGGLTGEGAATNTSSTDADKVTNSSTSATTSQAEDGNTGDANLSNSNTTDVNTGNLNPVGMNMSGMNAVDNQTANTNTVPTASLPSDDGSNESKNNTSNTGPVNDDSVASKNSNTTSKNTESSQAKTPTDPASKNVTSSEKILADDGNKKKNLTNSPEESPECQTN
ncbi:hypothetical protein O181_002544 [Austropuccinia psidii MF-1]|uniref:Uncharacterized protein n=1 Tax=Austropuccinia psidii MF-1 TaxID=1389203 RepID=A0A9Q3BCM2_9BASI|nr:hypothetical protein [Austropuccinia psidii MF-1]